MEETLTRCELHGHGLVPFGRWISRDDWPRIGPTFAAGFRKHSGELPEAVAARHELHGPRRLRHMVQREPAAHLDWWVQRPEREVLVPAHGAGDFRLFDDQLVHQDSHLVGG